MIINPLVIYLIGTLNSLKICIALITAGCVGYVVMNLINLDTNSSFGNDDYETEQKRFCANVKKGIIAIIVLLIAEVIIPDSELAITMYIAKFVTVDNVNMSVEAIKSATDYIIDAINSIK